MRGIDAIKDERYLRGTCSAHRLAPAMGRRPFFVTEGSVFYSRSTRKPAAPEDGTEGGSKTIRIKKAGHTFTGTVRSVRAPEPYERDSDMYHVELSHGKPASEGGGRTKGGGRAKAIAAPERTSSHHVPSHVAKKLRVGQKVRVHFEPL